MAAMEGQLLNAVAGQACPIARRKLVGDEEGEEGSVFMPTIEGEGGCRRRLELVMVESSPKDIIRDNSCSPEISDSNTCTRVDGFVTAYYNDEGGVNTDSDEVSNTVRFAIKDAMNAGYFVDEDAGVARVSYLGPLVLIGGVHQVVSDPKASTGVSTGGKLAMSATAIILLLLALYLLMMKRQKRLQDAEYNEGYDEFNKLNGGKNGSTGGDGMYGGKYGNGSDLDRHGNRGEGYDGDEAGYTDDDNSTLSGGGGYGKGNADDSGEGNRLIMPIEEDEEYDFSRLKRTYSTQNTHQCTSAYCTACVNDRSRGRTRFVPSTQPRQNQGRFYNPESDRYNQVGDLGDEASI